MNELYLTTAVSYMFQLIIYVLFITILLSWFPKINWNKECRECQTKYTYKNGEEIKVNDGNTFIQIQPLEKELVIE